MHCAVKRLGCHCRHHSFQPLSLAMHSAQELKGSSIGFGRFQPKARSSMEQKRAFDAAT